MKTKQDKQQKKSYFRPTLERFGSITRMTAGGPNPGNEGAVGSGPGCSAAMSIMTGVCMG